MRRAVYFLAVLSLVLLAPAPAGAELTEKGNLFIRFDGALTPNALPRQSRVPISVRIEGMIRQIGGDSPPALRQMEVAINRAGHLDTKGLPVCKRNRLRGASSAEAIEACGSALVGDGGYTVGTTLPDQADTVSPGEILLFNSRNRGQATVLAQAFQSEPVPLERIFVFKIRHRRRGAYGYTVAADVPVGLSRHGYLKSIYLHLGRTYAYRGRRHSYLSAACPAPAGFSVAVFPFAHASMSFVDGRTLASTLTRSCRVR
jgi:hypothetical protein